MENKLIESLERAYAGIEKRFGCTEDELKLLYNVLVEFISLFADIVFVDDIWVNERHANADISVRSKRSIIRCSSQLPLFYKISTLSHEFGHLYSVRSFQDFSERSADIEAFKFARRLSRMIPELKKSAICSIVLGFLIHVDNSATGCGNSDLLNESKGTGCDLMSCINEVGKILKGYENRTNEEYEMFIKCEQSTLPFIYEMQKERAY